MKLSKADCPRGIITFRNIQHSVSEDPGMISYFFEGKKIGNFSSMICILIKQFCLRIDVSTLTYSHNKFVSIYSMDHL